MFPCMRFSLQDNASVGSFSKLDHLTLAAQNLLPTPINLWKRKVVKDPVRRRCQNERSLSKLNTIWTLNRSGFWWDEYFGLIWGDVDVVTNCQRRLRLSSQIVGKSRIIRAILTTKHWFPPSVNPSSLIAIVWKKILLLLSFEDQESISRGVCSWHTPSSQRLGAGWFGSWCGFGAADYVCGCGFVNLVNDVNAAGFVGLVGFVDFV